MSILSGCNDNLFLNDSQITNDKYKFYMQSQSTFKPSQEMSQVFRASMVLNSAFLQYMQDWMVDGATVVPEKFLCNHVDIVLEREASYFLLLIF